MVFGKLFKYSLVMHALAFSRMANTKDLKTLTNQTIARAVKNNQLISNFSQKIVFVRLHESN